jgi:hypothetical protein
MATREIKFLNMELMLLFKKVIFALAILQILEKVAVLK